MTELDVTLTDYGLALECAALTYLVRRGRGPASPLRGWFSLYFGSLGTAALAGGTVHGFFLDPATTGARVLWPATLLATGLTAVASWAIGARLQFGTRLARRVIAGATLTWAGYALVILFVSHTFAVAIIHYLPAAVFLLVAFAAAYRRTGAQPILAGAVGLGLTLVAAGVQQAGAGLHPAYFNHNALAHVIQAGALLLVFLAARWLVAHGGA